MKKFLSIMSLCMVTILSLVALVSCGPDYEELLKLVLVQEGAVTEDFTVISQLTRDEEVYAIQWASDSEYLVVASEANADNTYTVSVVRPEDEQATAHLTATLGKATKTFEFKINPYDVYDFSSEFQFAYDKKNVSGTIELPTSYTLAGTDKVATITWSSANEELIKVDGDKAYVPYTYTKLQTKISATFTYKGETTTKPYSVVVYDQLVYVNETELVEGQAYKLGFLQVNLENEYYFVTGEQSGNYGATSKVVAEGADFFIQAVEGGYNIYFMNGETKTYLNGKPNDAGTSVYVNYAAEATTVWVWNTEYNTFTTDVNGTTFYMGTYSSYATLSCSKISYAPTSFVSQWYKEGVMDSNVPTYTENDKLVCEYLSYAISTQSEGQLELITAGKKFSEVAISYAVKDDGHGAIVLKDGLLLINNVKENTKVVLTVTFTLGEATMTRDVEFRVKPLEAPTEILDVVTEFEADTEYYFGFNQDNLGATHFFTGAMNGYYGATSKESAEGVKVTATAVEGGYNLSFVDKDGNTCYISAVASGEHLNFVFNAETPSVWTWNADYNTFITMVGDKEVFMGTYGTYNTMSISTTDKLASNFPAHFYDLTKITDEIMVSETVKELESKLELGIVTEETVVRLVSLYDVEVSVELPEGSEALAWDADYLILTLTPQSAAKTSEDIKVTVTKGEVTQTFTVTVITTTATEITIAEAKTLEDGLDAVIVGTVESIDEAWSTQYNNITVTLKDDTGTILVYRLKTNVEVGAKIIVTGKVGSYNDNKQIVNATAEIIGGTVTIPQFLALEDGADIVVKGTVKSIDGEWNETYGNMNVTITDGTNDLYVYRLKTQVAVGDEVTITGKVGSYNGNKQVTNGTAVIAEKPAEGVLTATTTWGVANSIEVKNSTDIGLDASLFTTTFVQNQASNPTKFYTSGAAIRMYGNNGNGCQMMVEANGAKILTVKISYVSGYNNATVYAGNLETKLTDTDDAANVAVYEVNNSTFVIKNENSGTTQVRITSIEIVYQLAE